MNNSFKLATAYNLLDSVEYAEGSVVSKILIKNDAGNISLFAFDKEQSLSKHTAPFDAFVQILEGEANIIIDDIPAKLGAGDGIIMPANIPHAVEAPHKFKMLLIMMRG